MNKLRISQEGLALPLPAEDISKLLDMTDEPSKEPCTRNKENRNTENATPRNVGILKEICNKQEERRAKEGGKTSTIKKELVEDQQSDIDQSDTCSHHPQMIDEDVETFTHKLDSLILTFRTDSLKEFMRIKRNVLSEQASKIEAEKNRCSALLSAKQDELERLKDDLVVATTQAKRGTTQVERLAGFSLKYNRHSQVFLFKFFAGWKSIAQMRKRKHKVITEHKSNSYST